MRLYNMKIKTIFSIIIPVYNAENYLERCIESVLNQTESSFELLLINDGSTDRSLEICNHFAERDSRIIVFTQENAGVSSARNIGISNASGEYITFVDSDDFVGKSFLSNFSEVLNKESSDLVISGFNLYYENDTTKNSVKLLENQDVEKIINVGQQIAETEMASLLSGPFAKVFRRKIINENKIFFDINFHFGEDAIFNHTFLQYITTLQIIDSVEYQYVQSERDSLVKRKYSFQQTIDYIKDLTLLRLNTIDRFYIKNALYIDFIEKEKTLYLISAVESMYDPAYRLNTKIRIGKIRKLVPQLRLELLPKTSAHYTILNFIYSLKSPQIMDVFLKIYLSLKRINIRVK